MAIKLLPFNSDPGSPGTINILEGSAEKTGDWVPVDAFDTQTFQTFAMSGTTSGTWAGSIHIQATLDTSSVATPENILTFTASGLKQNTIRCSHIRAVCDNWSGDNYVMLMRPYHEE